MGRWVLRSFFVLGVLILFVGAVGDVSPVLAVGAILILIALLPTERSATAAHTPSVVEADGHSWTQRSDGTWLRWEAEARIWQDAEPPPPEVLRRAPVAATTDGNGARTITGVIAAVLVAASLWAFFDPRAQIPLISPIVCSVKGQTWHAGSTSVPAGCYQREL